MHVCCVMLHDVAEGSATSAKSAAAHHSFMQTSPTRCLQNVQLEAAAGFILSSCSTVQQVHSQQMASTAAVGSPLLLLAGYSCCFSLSKGRTSSCMKGRNLWLGWDLTACEALRLSSWHLSVSARMLCGSAAGQEQHLSHQVTQEQRQKGILVWVMTKLTALMPAPHNRNTTR